MGAVGVQDDCRIAELTGLNTRTGWPESRRLVVRRVHPSARDTKKLTEFEKQTGWRYQVTATNIGRMRGVAGSHQPQRLDVLHRAHAGVEDRVRTNKAMGLANLPSKQWTTNRGWILADDLAADLHAWTRLLSLHDQDDLKDAEPDTLRYRLLRLPAKLTRPDLNPRHPDPTPQKGPPTVLRPVEPDAAAATREGPTPSPEGRTGSNRTTTQAITTAEESRLTVPKLR